MLALGADEGGVVGDGDGFVAISEEAAGVIGAFASAKNHGRKDEGESKKLKVRSKKLGEDAARVRIAGGGFY
jgi:hypothetical protein